MPTVGSRGLPGACGPPWAQARKGAEADIIAPRTANEVTVNGDLAVSGAFLVDTERMSEANQISIDDSVTISGTTVASSLLVNGIEPSGPTQA